MQHNPPKIKDGKIGGNVFPLLRQKFWHGRSFECGWFIAMIL